MDLNQLYSSANSFWDQISPIIYAHVFFLLAVRFIAGVRVPVRSTWNSLSGSDRYNEIKRMLEDLQVWSKLPYLLIVLLLFYFVLFSDLIGLLSLSRYTTVPYSPVELWVEFKPVDDLQTIGSFGENSKTSLENLSILKTSLLEQYRAENPREYKQYVGFLVEDLGRTTTYYHLAIVALVASFVLFFFELRRSRGLKRWVITPLRFLLLWVAIVVVIGLMRLQTEHKIEQVELAERFYLVSRLTVNPPQGVQELSKEGRETLRAHLDD
jgi:hypothetical protein